MSNSKHELPHHSTFVPVSSSHSSTAADIHMPQKSTFNVYSTSEENGSMQPRSNKVEPAGLDRSAVQPESTDGLESEQILKVSEGTRNTQETLVSIVFPRSFFPLSLS